ncbi:MAG: hypothetical protein ABFS03_06875 [Chloroflexota bacterium]
MITWKTYYVELQRLEDEASLAQQANLEGHIMMHNTTRGTLTNHLLAMLGTKLISWGNHLQDHYADMKTPAPTQSMQSNA